MAVLKQKGKGRAEQGKGGWDGLQSGIQSAIEAGIRLGAEAERRRLLEEADTVAVEAVAVHHVGRVAGHEHERSDVGVVHGGQRDNDVAFGGVAPSALPQPPVAVEVAEARARKLGRVFF